MQSSRVILRPVMSVRMKDIAHTLGISQTTVSHVLRGRDGEFRIGAETARRVRATVERLGYRPSVLARNLKHHRAYALAVAVGDLADPFWSALALGAQQEAERHGYVLVVSHTGETLDKERQLLEMLRERRGGGLILAPAPLMPPHPSPRPTQGRPRRAGCRGAPSLHPRGPARPAGPRATPAVGGVGRRGGPLPGGGGAGAGGHPPRRAPAALDRQGRRDDVKPIPRRRWALGA